MTTVFEVGGTYNTFGASNPPSAELFYLKGKLDPRLNWIGIPYPGELVGMKGSVAAGVTNLIAAINANPGPFLLVGTSQGAIVTSNVYDELRTGSLQHRRADLLAAVAFGNPRREPNHLFPGCESNPGGHGIDAGNLLVGTEGLWWEFAVPGDDVTCCPSDAGGQELTSLFNLVWNATSLWSLLFVPGGWSAVIALANLFYTAEVTHNLYMGTVDLFGQIFSYYPLNDGRTCLSIAIEYLNTFA